MGIITQALMLKFCMNIPIYKHKPLKKYAECLDKGKKHDCTGMYKGQKGATVAAG